MITLDALIKAVQTSVVVAAEEVAALNQASVMQYFDDVEEGSGPAALTPKMVAIDYPQVTREGARSHTVHVPLIALAPVSNVRLQSLVFRADLDVQIDEADGEVRESLEWPLAPAVAVAGFCGNEMRIRTPE